MTPVTVSVRAYTAKPVQLDAIEREMTADAHNLEQSLRRAGQRIADSIASKVTQGEYADALLPDTLRRSIDLERLPDGAAIRVGNFDDLGDPDENAPKGTIKEFLEGAGRKWKNVFVGVDGEEHYGKKKGFNPKYAWIYLPHQAKLELNALRQAGMYGGAQNGRVVPAYWWLQESGQYPSESPVPQLFVERSLGEVREAVHGLLDDLMVRL